MVQAFGVYPVFLSQIFGNVGAEMPNEQPRVYGCEARIHRFKGRACWGHGEWIGEWSYIRDLGPKSWVAD